MSRSAGRFSHSSPANPTPQPGGACWMAWCRCCAARRWARGWTPSRAWWPRAACTCCKTRAWRPARLERWRCCGAACGMGPCSGAGWRSPWRLGRPARWARWAARCRVSLFGQGGLTGICISGRQLHEATACPDAQRVPGSAACSRLLTTSAAHACLAAAQPGAPSRPLRSGAGVDQDAVRQRQRGAGAAECGDEADRPHLPHCIPNSRGPHYAGEAAAGADTGRSGWQGWG